MTLQQATHDAIKSGMRLASKSATVLFSGGLDSTVCLWWALHHYDEVNVVTVDYGQKHRSEISASERIFALSNLSGHQTKISITQEPERDFSRNIFLRGHTAMLVGLSAMSIGHKGGDILLGTLATDPFDDVQDNFITALAAGLAHRDDQNPIRILQPLKKLKGKVEVAQLGFELGAPWHLSWSCRGSSGSTPCDECPTCYSRNKAIEEFLSRGHAVSGAVSMWKEWQECFGAPIHPTFRDLTVEQRELVDEFLRADGITNPVRGWRYFAPDRTERITRFMNPPEEVRKRFGAPGDPSHISVSGFLPKMEGTWELVVCEDGSVAASPRLPSITVLERALIESVR